MAIQFGQVAQQALNGAAASAGSSAGSVIGDAISHGINGLGNLLSFGKLGKYKRRKEEKALQKWKDQLQYASDLDYSNWQKQQDYMNAYNDPSSERRRLQKAGYNPWMANSMAGSVSAQSVSANGNAQGTVTGAGEHFSNSLATEQLELQKQMQIAQLENLRANTRKTNADASGVETDNETRGERNFQEINNLIANWKAVNKGTELTGKQIEDLASQIFTRDALANSTIDLNRAQIDKAKAEYDRLSYRFKDEIDNQLRAMDDTHNLSQAEYVKLLAEAGLAQAQAEAIAPLYSALGTLVAGLDLQGLGKSLGALLNKGITALSDFINKVNNGEVDTDYVGKAIGRSDESQEAYKEKGEVIKSISALKKERANLVKGRPIWKLSKEERKRVHEIDSAINYKTRKKLRFT